MEQPILYVDRREGSKDLLQPLIDMGLPAVEDEFDADLMFDGRGEKGTPMKIGIEFKKLPELAQSLQTGRLAGHQLLKMRKAFAVSYLLTEGDIEWDDTGRLTRRSRGRFGGGPVPMGGMRINEFLKRIHVLHLRGGLNPLWSRNREGTLKHIEVLYRVWTDQDLDEHKSHLAIYQAPALVELSQTRKTLATLPGVGWRVSLAAEQHFGGLRRALLGGVKEWAAVEVADRHGKTKQLGTKIAEKIVEALNG